MRQIIKVKGREPKELTAWKKTNPHGRYQDLDRSSVGKSVRQAIRRDAIEEQLGLCGYCCKSINLENNSTNEHLISQKSDQNQTLNFENIIASCNTKNRCNQVRGSQYLPLTPIMPECETELKFYLSGKVEGETQRAIDIIKALGLDNKAIREERKQLLDSLIYSEYYQPDTFPEFEDERLEDEFLNDLIATLDKPDNSGMLPPYGPVLINIIRGFLNNP